MSRTVANVGVVVLNFRNAADTLRCLDSLASLDRRPIVTVVDNASGDGSADAIADRLASGDLEPATLIRHHENAGFAGGCIVGLDALRERQVQFAWLLNNDAEVEPGTLDALLDAADDPTVGAVGSVIFDGDDRESVLTWGGGSVGEWTGFTHDARSPADRVDYLTGASLLVRLDALDDVGGLDPSYFFTWEDVDLSRRLTGAGWRIAVAERSRVWHRSGGTLAPTSPARMRHHAAGLVRYMRKHSRVPVVSALPMLAWYLRTAARERRPAIFGSAVRGWVSGWTS